jgi:hypothetical protein
MSEYASVNWRTCRVEVNVVFASAQPLYMVVGVTVGRS